MNRKVIASTCVLFLALLGELILWNNSVIFSALLILLAYTKHKIYPIRKELFWYVLICVCGTIVEAILVNLGHGWSYSNPDIFGIPLWIPLFWGLIGTTIIVLYDGLTKPL